MTRHKALDTAGRAVMVNGSDLIQPQCMRCKRAGTRDTLRVAARVNVPPAGMALWVCADGCPPAGSGQGCAR